MSLKPYCDKPVNSKIYLSVDISEGLGGQSQSYCIMCLTFDSQLENSEINISHVKA